MFHKTDDYLLSGTHFYVTPNVGGAGKTKELYSSFEELLKSLGFTVGYDPKVKEDSCLFEHYRYGRLNELEVKFHAIMSTLEIEFFQNVVFDNPNGGEYDYSKLQKMPYLCRLRFTKVSRLIQVWLENHGVQKRYEKRTDWLNDPVGAFQDSWDFDIHRNEGRPRFSMEKIEKRQNSWDRHDGDKTLTSWGDRKFVRVRGRWMACRVYDGINGMWKCVSNAEVLVCDCVSRLRANFPGRDRQFTKDERVKRVLRCLDRSVAERDYLKAHRIQSFVKRFYGEETLDLRR